MIELNPPVSGNNRLRFIIPYTGTRTIYSSPPAYNIEIIFAARRC